MWKHRKSSKFTQYQFTKKSTVLRTRRKQNSQITSLSEFKQDENENNFEWKQRYTCLQKTFVIRNILKAGYPSITSTWLSINHHVQHPNIPPSCKIVDLIWNKCGHATTSVFQSFDVVTRNRLCGITLVTTPISSVYQLEWI